MTLDGKRIVLLGGSSGIGLSVAQAAAREGAQVVIVSSQQERGWMKRCARFPTAHWAIRST